MIFITIFLLFGFIIIDFHVCNVFDIIVYNHTRGWPDRDRNIRIHCEQLLYK